MTPRCRRFVPPSCCGAPQLRQKATQAHVKEASDFRNPIRADVRDWAASRKIREFRHKSLPCGHDALVVVAFVVNATAYQRHALDRAAYTQDP